MKYYRLIKGIRKPARTLIPIFKGFAKWCILSVITGAAVGIISSIFYIGLKYVQETRENHPIIIWLLPVGGLAVVFIYHMLKLHDDKGTNMVLVAVRDGEELTYKNTISIFLGTIITHLFGGSAGREGAALQIGGSIGSQAGIWLKLNEQDKRLITMCGMSAGFSALFGTPAAAAFFAMEVISVGVMHYSAIVPCAAAAFTGYKISSLFGVVPESFKVNIPSVTSLFMLKAALLAVLCGLLSIFFCYVLKNASYLYRKFFKNTYIRIAAGGLLVALLTFICGTYDFNGSGMHVIMSAFTENSHPYEFAVKLLFTALTLGAGFKGGEILPVFFVGATFGSAVAPVLGMDCSAGAAIGLVSVFCGVTNCPVTAVIIAAELFGAENIMVYALVCAVSYMLSGYAGLYSEQKILYSKIEPKYIDKKIGK